MCYIHPISCGTVEHQRIPHRLKPRLKIQPSKLESQDDDTNTVWLNSVYSWDSKSPWRLLTDQGLWRIYAFQRPSCSHRYELYILPKRNLTSFLSDMPDAVPLSSLLLPGTHDTMAFYGWPISQCQSMNTPLAIQLQSGIRVLDVRLAVIDGRLIAYHGVYPQRTPFQEILHTIHSFLTSDTGKRETIVMSIKQEDFATTPTPVFSACVHDEIYDGPGGRQMWILNNRIPTLGEVRGKVVMFSRFGGNGDGWDNGLEGLGLHPTTWPDSEKYGFTWQCKDTTVRTHDWYAIPSFLSIPEKVQLATQILDHRENVERGPAEQTLSITYFSASSFPLAFPPTVAQGLGWPQWGFGFEGVNSRIGSWLFDKLVIDEGEDVQKRASTESRLRGWAFMDFYAHPVEGGLVPLLVEFNYRGRLSGEEGWP